MPLDSLQLTGFSLWFAYYVSTLSAYYDLLLWRVSVMWFMYVLSIFNAATLIDIINMLTPLPFVVGFLTMMLSLPFDESAPALVWCFLCVDCFMCAKCILKEGYY